MRIVIIGSSGHVRFCLPKYLDSNRDFVAIAPGSEGESMVLLEQQLKTLGYKPKLYWNYREMLLNEKPDIAVVDNYYGEHGQVILAALETGCHVFAEKPAAADLKQLDCIEKAWKKAGTLFVPMFNYRYNGAFYSAWSLIRGGAIGKIQLLNAQKSYKFGNRPAFMQQRDTYGGTLPWVGIHAIDWILWMSAGQFESVYATQSAAAAPNGKCPQMTALALFQMDQGKMASLTVDYLNPPSAHMHGDDRIRVVGTEGVIEVCNGRVKLTNEHGVQLPEICEDGDLFTDFLLQISGKGKCRISAEEAFAATRGALAAQQAADSGEIVYF